MEQPHGLQNTVDPTGHSTREQLIYLNPHNAMEVRRAAMQKHDAEFCGVPMDSYTDADIERECYDTRAALGSDFPVFTGPNA